MCDRIRFVSPLVCPRREGQLVCPLVRQGLKPLSQSESPLKRTQELVDVHRFEANLESVSTDFSYETGVLTPGGHCLKAKVLSFLTQELVDVHRFEASL